MIALILLHSTSSTSTRSVVKRKSKRPVDTTVDTNRRMSIQNLNVFGELLTIISYLFHACFVEDMDNLKVRPFGLLDVGPLNVTYLLKVGGWYYFPNQNNGKSIRIHTLISFASYFASYARPIWRYCSTPGHVCFKPALAMWYCEKMYCTWPYDLWW